VTSSACFWLAQTIEFNTLEIIWQRSHWWALAKIYALLTVPFFFAANAIALTMVRFKQRVAALYACDLLGAGIGGLSTVVLLYSFSPGSLLFSLSISVLMVCVYVELQFSAHYVIVHRWLILGLLCSLVISLVYVPKHVSDIKPVSFKALSKAILLPGAKVENQYYSPLGVVSVVESPVVPLRIVPGLSLASTASIPPQKAIFIDGDGPTAINKFIRSEQNRNTANRYLHDLTSSVPYYLLNKENRKLNSLQVGLDHPALLQSQLFFEDSTIDVVEVNARIGELLTKDYAEYAGWASLNNRIRIHSEDARGFLSSSSEQYDMIALRTAGSFQASLSALKPDFRYTVEAFSQYFHRLKPQGVIAVATPIALPPRTSLKVLATALQMLQEQAVADASRHILMIRGWKTAALIVSKSPITDQQINKVKIFCKARWFDLVYFSGVERNNVNHFNRLSSPDFYLAAISLIEDMPHFINQYKFMIAPATDDQPYFYRFFKWSSLNEFLAFREFGGAALIDQGYPMLVIALALALAFTLILIPLPLFSQKEKVGEVGRSAGKNQTVVAQEYTEKKITRSILFYFFLVGLGFMFVEIAVIQRMALFLDHAVISAAVIISSFLIFAGLGSYHCRRYGARPAVAIRLSITIVVILLSIYLFFAGSVLALFIDRNLVFRVLVAALMVAPIAFVMGMPFPLGLSALVMQRGYWVAWAWGINGCASVVSTIAATLLAIHWGFTVVLILAILIYSAAAIMFSRH
jgi:spermidine synthase